jgi:hypothetical protein
MCRWRLLWSKDYQFVDALLKRRRDIGLETADGEQQVGSVALAPQPGKQAQDANLVTG